MRPITLAQLLFHMRWALLFGCSFLILLCIVVANRDRGTAALDSVLSGASYNLNRFYMGSSGAGQSSKRRLRPEEPAEVAVIVLPSVVPGLTANDRHDRISTMLDTWGTVSPRVHFIILRDLGSPQRDSGLHPNVFWPLDESIVANKDKLKKFGVQRALMSAVMESMPWVPYFLIMHDHVMVLPDNLLDYIDNELEAPLRSAPDGPERVHALRYRKLFMTGNELHIDHAKPRTWFVSEPAGMLLSRGTMRRFDDAWHEQKCLPAAPWLEDNPCHVLCECFLDMSGMFADSRESDNNNAERFNIYPPVRVAHRHADDWYLKFKNFATADALPTSFPRRPITFHYVDNIESQWWYDFLHGTRYDNVTSGAQYLTASQLGPYSEPAQTGVDPVFDLMRAVKIDMAIRRWK